ncbi:lysophospholipid acyltransferase 7 [Sitophilus oryzae]|uniref:Lysophospholipid acyltransferase 7 n=1 Tax=Sitophilus oryzae TaxID=7048 RepID=A0A6J2YP45_SITOR|nr:lysophospholipid acyltransferase 7 [Sitophilus oryzae]
MNFDDYVYLFFLVFSIGFGLFYRQLPDAQSKRKIGALVGFSIVLIVSRLHILHILLTIFVNSLIILYFSKRYCHIISFVFSFIYLIFFRTTIYFGIPYPPSHTNLVQMILTLKLVGLAFEVNSSHINTKKKDEAKKTNEEIAQNELHNIDLTFLDIFCYSINYIGVLTGPYYKYQTYYDHLYKPFNKYDDYKSTIKKRLLPFVPIFAAIYLLTDYLWPLSYTATIEFEQRSFLYRYWYIWPTFLNFRMRIYIGLILSECVCVLGGMGVYPRFCKNQPGNGPTEHFVKLHEICDNEDILSSIEYNYKTVLNINPYGTEFYPTLREGMRNWNITVQYWLAMCIYKRFPYKKFRTFATMFVSGVWHGVYSGYYISVGMIPFGLIVEDLWVQILLKDEFYMPKNLGYVIMLFLKMQFFSYAALAFSLLHVDKIIHYYNSVYHWIILFYIVLYIVGKKLLKNKRNKLVENKVETTNEKIEYIKK